MRERKDDDERDGVGAASIAAMCESDVFGVYTQRLQVILRDKCAQLEADQPEASTQRLRGEIRQLREVLELPRVLRDELQASGAGNKRGRR